MKERHLKQMYAYDSTQKVYQIGIALDNYRDVYSEWDYSPMANRDLDDDLFDYLMDCSKEIGLKRAIEVHFFIPPNIVDVQREKKSVEGFRHYFAYRIRKVKGERMRILQRSVLLFGLGGFFLLTANILQTKVELKLVGELLSEGLFIGAWVAIWEIFSSFLFDYQDLNLKIRHYERLKKAPLAYDMKESQRTEQVKE